MQRFESALRSGQKEDVAAESIIWSARLVQPATDEGVGKRASFLRKEFALEAPSGAERLYISAQGLYRAFINGERVGEDLLTPGWTAYDKRLSYQVYDVARHLKPDVNVIDIWLGDGWFRSPLLWPRSQVTNTWGDSVGAIAELRSDASPNAPLLAATDDTWRSGLLPILRSGIYFGEIYDARKETLTATDSARVLPFDTSILVRHETTPVRELPAIAPKQEWQESGGRTVYDFGQNLAGYTAITVAGKAGARVVVEHAEVLDKDGRFDRTSARSAEARIEYFLSGNGTERYRPYFTFHGFRYARVTIDGDARLESIESVPISSTPERSSAFVSGNALVNRLVENTVWSQRSNFIDVPTDCPQRDERLGWTGDAQVFAGAACYLADSHTFLRKWLRDVMADQRADGAISHFSPDPTRLHPVILPGGAGSAGWGDAICVVPWTLWIHYGDRGVLEETLPAMARWVDFLWGISNGPIVHPPRQLNERGFTFGDWLQPSGSTEKPLPTCGDDMVATIYLYISASIAAKTAKIVGNDTLFRRMSKRASAVKRAFAAEFISKNGRLVYDDQTSYALAIVHDLIPEQHLAAAHAHFKVAIARSEGRVGTGFLGTPALLPALIKIGEPELAASVFLQEEAPGWLYQVKTGATTIWERWDAIRPDGSSHSAGMNSFNHYAYGAVCQWLFEAVAGFCPDPDAPGFRNIVFSPTVIPALAPVEASFQSPVGRIEAGWSVEGDAVTYRIRVPDGAQGTLILPADYRDVVVDGGRSTSEFKRAALSAGAHTVTFRIGDAGRGHAADTPLQKTNRSRSIERTQGG